MCGIAGILRVTPQGEKHAPITDETLDALDRAIAWRGPDGTGRFRDRVHRSDGATVEVALVHRRLAIIDLASGAQPMISPVGRTPDEGLVAVVFNGCVYNHRELRAQLSAVGRTFCSDHSDTEVLIHSWREARGADRADRSWRSMHTVAIWDRGSATLTLFRDRFGEKPLYERRLDDHGSRVFSSVAAGPLVCGASPDPAALMDWVSLGFSESRMPWREVTAARRCTPVRTLDRRTQPIGPGAFDHLLDRAVAERLDADVPLGCFLSGGIDSSLIAHYAKRHMGRLTTLCVRMPDPRYDESAHAERVARHIGSDHVTLDVSPTAATDLVELIRVLGLPFADSSLLPTYWLCKAARAHLKVALSGDGGDELFCGYERYRAAGWLRHLRGLAPAISILVPDGRDPRGRASKAARLLRASNGKGYTDLLAIIPSALRRELFAGAGAECECPRFDGVDAARCFDLDEYLPGDLLRKVDTASLAAGLEVRCPFLAAEVADAALAVPTSRHLRGGRTKSLLREVAAIHLPDDIVARPKQGFAVPIGEWFRNDFAGLKKLMSETLDRSQPLGWVGAALGLREPALKRVIAEHLQGSKNHGQVLYSLTVMGIWAALNESHSAPG